jgi:hypothetical protein
MTETIIVKTPDSWKDVTLRKYLALQNDLENYKDDEQAQLDFMLYHLCSLDASVLKSLTKESYEKLTKSIENLLSQQESPLQPIITIDSIEYGFEPNLSKISYGAYVDITKWDTIAMNDNWAKIMSVIYRPIVDKKKDKYQIASYNGEMDGDLFLDVSMDVHFGAWFFFVHLSMDLLNSTLNYMTHKAELPDNIKSILEKSGKDTHLSTNLQEEI